jgi:uncharacterized protein (DUF58 family)
MLVGTLGKPKTLDDLLPAHLAGRLDRLDLLSRKILSGKLPGERRSKRRGRSVEFDDFRQYLPGDDLRHIDWNVYARLDRLFVKLFREEEDLALTVVIDASPSMDAGEPNKLLFAARLATAVAYVGLVNQNRVSVGVFGNAAGEGLRLVAPSRGRRGVRRVTGFVLEMLDRASRGGGGTPAAPAQSFAKAMRTLASGTAGRGVVLVISDFLMPAAGKSGSEPGGWSEGLMFLGARAASGMADVYAVQVLSPQELDPARSSERGIVGDLRLTDVETGAAAEVTVTPDTIATYRQRLRTHQEVLRRALRSRGVAHTLAPSDAAVDELVLTSLRRGGLLK